jgi:hypothetical protein
MKMLLAAESNTAGSSYYNATQTQTRWISQWPMDGPNANVENTGKSDKDLKKLKNKFPLPTTLLINARSLRGKTGGLFAGIY